MKVWGALSLLHFILLTVGLLFGHSALQPAKPAPTCRLGELKFRCPTDFTPVEVPSEHTLSVFSNPGSSIGLFVLLPDEKLSDEQLVNNISKAIVAKIFPKEAPAFTWKAIDPSRVVSKFETGGGVLLAYNGSLNVLIKYRHVDYKNTKIIVGYAAAFGTGPQGKEIFELGLGGDSTPGCDAAVEVIYSITGEKVTKDNHPCSLTAPVK